MNTKKHWETVYQTKQENELGWYQQKAEQSISLVGKCKLSPTEAIIDIGSGASVFIEDLLELGHTNIIATDISGTGLEKTKGRLSAENAAKVRFIVDDVTQPQHLQNIGQVALWHDRAVLHFLLTDDERQRYVQLLKKMLKPGGYAIIAAFSTEGAKKCSGLNICNYDENMLSGLLGEGFELKESFNYTHFNPRGEERPFVYTLFKRAG